jgi:hydantoinase/carbamoylase family amidase
VIALDPAALGARADAMLTALAAITADPGRLTRLYLTPEHRRAADRVAAWMRAAGLAVREDALATVRGRLEAANGTPRTLILGSHIDTVIDAGRFDGALGVIAAIVAVDALRQGGADLPFAVEVCAFGDEEGVRFPTTLLGSSAVAGILDPADLDRTDADGITVRDALAAYGCDVGTVAAARIASADAVGYLEVHIEQGPVLEREGLALGVVTAIAGATRAVVTVTGDAGHAGTVPMGLRRDALAAASELVLAVERIGQAGAADELVATVGRLTVRPGAVNVVPGAVELSLDVRAASDAPRSAAMAAISAAAAEIAGRRGVGIEIAVTHDRDTAACTPAIVDGLADAVASLGLPPRRLMSGAGHDGQAMAMLTDIGMIFVRCRGGVSHNPAEYASPEDIGLAVAALVRAVEGLAEKERERR